MGIGTPSSQSRIPRPMRASDCYRDNQCDGAGLVALTRTTPRMRERKGTARLSPSLQSPSALDRRATCCRIPLRAFAWPGRPARGPAGNESGRSGHGAPPSRGGRPRGASPPRHDAWRPGCSGPMPSGDVGQPSSTLVCSWLGGCVVPANWRARPRCSTAPTLIRPRSVRHFSPDRFRPRAAFPAQDRGR